MKIDNVTKVVWAVAFVGGFGLAYLWPNLYPSGVPRELPLFAWERAIPLVPWTFLVYLSDYVLGIYAVGRAQGRDFLSMARVATIAMVLSGICFRVFPTVYPRPPYPEASGLVGFAMALIGGGDTPNCCFPSMHIAMTAACIWGARNTIAAAWGKPFLVLWGLAIAVSTLTTKQHYALDILGGAVAFAVGLAVDRYLGDRGWPAWMFVGRKALASPSEAAHATGREKRTA